MNQTIYLGFELNGKKRVQLFWSDGRFASFTGEALIYGEDREAVGTGLYQVPR